MPLLLLLLMLSIYNVGISQPPRGPFVISPRVHADKKVTFSYLAPFAKQVLLGGSQFGARPGSNDQKNYLRSAWVLMISCMKV